MTTSIRNLLVGLGIAVGLALVLGGARIGGVQAWKVFMALAGLVLVWASNRRD